MGKALSDKASSKILEASERSAVFLFLSWYLIVGGLTDKEMVVQVTSNTHT